MTQEDALRAAQTILDKRAGEVEFRVQVDSPSDCTQTIKAFKALGCRVKTNRQETILTIHRPTSH